VVQEFRGWSYDQKLNALRWSTLENRCLRGDIIQVFELIKGFDFLAPNTFVNMSITSLRNHTLTLNRSAIYATIDKFYFLIELLKIGIV